MSKHYNAEVPTRIGRISTTNGKWDIDGTASPTEIEMVDCTTLIGKFALHLIIPKFVEDGDPNDLTQGFIRHKAFNPYRAHTRNMRDFVCPDAFSFPSEGYYGSSGTF